MFQPDRIYSHRNPKTGLTEWYFSAREGNFGPFRDRTTATKELDAFIKHCIETGDDGGRKSGKKSSKLSLVPMSDFSFKRDK
ncbi:MAG: DUF6316 family protein [Methylomonas sp.]|nr:DUF6316 family protein [Methylomonas sp.]